jgi:hypothetical protein
VRRRDEQTPKFLLDFSQVAHMFSLFMSFSNYRPLFVGAPESSTLSRVDRGMERSILWVNCLPMVMVRALIAF